MAAIVDFCTPPVPGETHKYYGNTHNHFIKLPQFTTKPEEPPSPATPTPVNKKTEEQQQKTLHSVASTGNLIILKQILLLLPDPLKALNDPHPSTGLTPIHFASSRGHVDIVRCLVEEYQVSLDSRDKEGETPLLKAAYAGHYHVVQYLLSKKANVHQKDKDGWTALHNACSRGFLPIARLLVERGARVNARNKMGHTPLINAASKGYMSIVEYLLDEAHANPLIKNSFGEAAYDVSAASGEAGEAYICEMLERAGSRWWHMQHTEGVDLSPYSQSSTYDLLDFHVTVMVILHENQRSTSLLGLSRPHFSAQALAKNDTRGPWSLHPSGIPSSKEEVKLPPNNSRSGGSNWFWLTDWQIDYSDPRVDPTSGWQYARSFEENDDTWTPVAPTGGYGWVRRRRWVRVMKRRMDLAKGRVEGAAEESGGNDYLLQVEDSVTSIQTTHDTEDIKSDNIEELLRKLTKELRVYEEAVQNLLAGIKTDTNQYRKHQATLLVTQYSAHIDRLNARVQSLAQQVSTPISPVQHNPELARLLDFSSANEEPTPSRAHASAYSNETTDFDANPWSRDSAVPNASSQPWSSATLQTPQDNSSLNHVDLLEQDDAASVAAATAAAGPRAFTWESDMSAKECRRCERRFGLIVRRHHCRRCGLIVCDKCSASRTYLNASEILQDPNGPVESVQVLASQHQRVCDKCYADLGMRA